jgi:hypothetical protein
VSHNKEREEKICLNCNAHVYGRYCHICGQENIQEKQTFGHLVTHFVYDVTHFDGKFFSTLKYLLFKPGFLSKEFLRGRRASYLDPIRMYVFTSAIFFIIFFSFVKKSDDFNENSVINDNKVDSTISSVQQQINTDNDTAEKKILLQQLESLKKKKKPKVQMQAGVPQGSGVVNLSVDSTDKDEDASLPFFGSHLPATLEKYDSIQNKRPANKKDGWFKYRIKKRLVTLNEAYRANKKEFWKTISERFQHAYPQMMFVSLPLAALILQLLYVRRRKQFFYASHAVFILHVYIAVYILLLIYYLFSGLHHASGWRVFGLIDILLSLSIIYYIYKAMRNFYGQGRIKTLFKYFIFSIFYLVIFVFLVCIFFIISVMQV